MLANNDEPVIPKLYKASQFIDGRGQSSTINFSDLYVDNNLPTRILHVTNPNQGTVRGFHGQLSPYSEDKILICLKGSIFDVVIDLRRDSTNFKHLYKNRIRANSFANYLFIPAGFWHGYQTLEANTDLLYVIKGLYRPDSNVAINPLDDGVGIKWPMDVTSISESDRLAMNLDIFSKKFLN